ncbi:unnamed protein product [Toxocara canis]|uniref:Ras association domain-containing protein 1 n=1 Tax=Toxocara canis TaxID=6265 RepID=A0A183V5W5_TOXCA|nr:unnamed protein product [Toxocara canis]
MFPETLSTYKIVYAVTLSNVERDLRRFNPRNLLESRHKRMQAADVSRTLDSRSLSAPSGISTDEVANPQKRLLSTQQPSWFAGLRSRISQLSMPEWLSQLGIGGSQHASNRDTSSVAAKSPHVVKSSPALRPLIEDVAGVDYVNDSYMFPVEYSSHTVDSFFDSSSISLEEGRHDNENLEWVGVIMVKKHQDWAMDSSLWSGDGDYSDTLVVQHFGPLKNLITGCQHPGKGHNFQSMSMAHPTWCDKCGDFMWGFLTHAVRCESCNYTCHARCKSLITLDCKTVDNSLKSTSDSDEAPAVNLYPDIRALKEEIASDEQRQEDVISEVENAANDEQFTGSVQIHMNFTRPINVVAGQSPPSFVDIVNGSGTATSNSLRTITTFFLPRNTVKNVNISSHMTTREMIVTLLRKFRVADNPRKFALYERICDNDVDDISKCERLNANCVRHQVQICHLNVEHLKYWPC